MCGIGAIYGKSPRRYMKNILNKMRHRGSDEGGIWEGPGIMLGHTRLSITGVNHGLQPIPNETKDIWLVCNGEIYNYKEIKSNQLAGHSFTGESDSEVILHLYEEYGEAALNYLEGMFAFVLADCRGERPKIFAARDPLGIKPLYYAEAKGSLFFASELKCLFDITDNVMEFPPGHYYLSQTGFAPYRVVESPPGSEMFDDSRGLSEITNGIRQVFAESVRRQMQAEVPVGMLLSGGLDSSLMCAVAKHLQPGRLKTFSVGLAGSPDLVAAREVAGFLNTEHHECVYTEDELWDAIPQVIYYLESFEPSLVRSAIPNFFVCQLAAKHVKVVLSGEGADELLGGYAYMKNIVGYEKFNCELIRALKSLHNIGLQRLDRMTMAHSLEGRVPFLDERVIGFNLRIPPRWKIVEENGRKIEKWILRRAYDGQGYLPEHILWRTKMEFSEGSGAKDALDRRLDDFISDHELHEEQHRLLIQDKVTIRSKQELHFYRIFKGFYPQPSALNAVGRWAIA